MTELEPRPGDELERQLDRFVRVRLDPSPAQVKRARSAVMEAAWRQRLGAPASGSAEDSSVAAAMTVLPSPYRGTAPSRGLFGGWSSRRLGASFAAAMLAGLMLGTSAFASSRAGGPLYDTRLSLEQLTLPSDPQARLEAELGLAQVRLAEVVEANARNDAGAIAAAVKGYLATLDDLDESVGGPADRALDAIQDHRTVLLGVLGHVPEQAQAGIENALAQSSKVIERLDAAATPTAGPTGGTSGPGGNGGAAGGGAGNGNGNGNGNGAGGGNGNGGAGAGAGGAGAGAGGAGAGNGGDPDPTPKVTRTPKPAKTPAPKPDRPDRPTPPVPDKGSQGGKP